MNSSVLLSTCLNRFSNSVSGKMSGRLIASLLLQKTVNPSISIGCTSYASKQNFRYFSDTPQRPPSFFGKIVENLKEEYSKNQEIKASYKKLKEDIQELEETEAIQKARRKYKIIEDETVGGTKKAKKQLDSLARKVKESVEEAQKAEIIQKASKVTEEATRQAQKMGETISQKGEELTRTETYKKLSETAKVVKDEIDQSTFGRGARVYRRPEKLQRRTDRDLEAEGKIIEANTEAMGIVLHRDSRLAQNWEDFKNNNAYVNRLMEWRTKLDESDNPVIRASILIKDKATELFGGVFQKTELSETLTEICKMDPNFDKERFLLECEYFIIPNILEAMIRSDLLILEDWCYERAYHLMSPPIKQSRLLGLRNDSKILDVDHVDLAFGKVTDEGPILVLTFQTQQIHVLRNDKGEVVDGDPKKVLRVQNVWVMCRDQMELNHHAAWRVFDVQMQAVEQFV